MILGSQQRRGGRAGRGLLGEQRTEGRGQREGGREGKKKREGVRKRDKPSKNRIELNGTGEGEEEEETWWRGLCCRA